MATVTFSGTVSAQTASGETVTITVTKPDSTTEVLTTTTTGTATFSTSKVYTVAGAYSAKAHGDADASYTSWDTAAVPFTVVLTTRTGTLNVTLS
jgi:hypothetical protein